MAALETRTLDQMAIADSAVLKSEYINHHDRSGFAQLSCTPGAGRTLIRTRRRVITEVTTCFAE